MDESFDIELRLRYPREAAIWQSIRHMLRREQSSFFDFHSYHGSIPPGHELRPKRDGKRSPFGVDHFEWLPIGTPKRADQALRRVEQPSFQDQLDELRREVGELRELIQGPPKGAVPLTIPPIKEPGKWCILERGSRLNVVENAENDPGCISVHATELEAMEAAGALAMKRIEGK